MFAECMKTNKTCEWETPQWLFDMYNEDFQFEVDVCALPENAKCKKYFTPTQDGLKQEWLGVCWMNPPYGREIKHWVRKAYESSQKGATVVCLLPSRTDTAWWHDYVMQGEITFLRGRLKFGNAKHGAPFPSAVVVFKPSAYEQISQGLQETIEYEKGESQTLGERIRELRKGAGMTQKQLAEVCEGQKWLEDHTDVIKEQINETD